MKAPYFHYLPRKKKKITHAGKKIQLWSVRIVGGVKRKPSKLNAKTTEKAKKKRTKKKGQENEGNTKERNKRMIQTNEREN